METISLKEAGVVGIVFPCPGLETGGEASCTIEGPVRLNRMDSRDVTLMESSNLVLCSRELIAQ
jgi:hypothetical protein